MVVCDHGDWVYMGTYLSLVHHLYALKKFFFFFFSYYDVNNLYDECVSFKSVALIFLLL